MKSFWKFILGFCCVLFFAAAAHAQMGRAPQFSGVWNPVVGAGAAYSVQARGETTEMEMAVIGKEMVEGKDGYWFEMTMQSPREKGTMVMKYLYVLEGAQTRIVRMVMQAPGQPPMEMPASMMGRMGTQPTQTADIRTQSQDVGGESVTTPAGTFACEHYRARDGSWDVWVAKDLPPYGLVKSQAHDYTMTLLRVITNAKDKITGTPQSMPDMSH
jgi:hypothetical protein